MKLRNRIICAVAGVGLLFGSLSIIADSTATPPSVPLTDNGQPLLYK